jgi:hypothetical protein
MIITVRSSTSKRGLIRMHEGGEADQRAKTGDDSTRTTHVGKNGTLGENETHCSSERSAGDQNLQHSESLHRADSRNRIPDSCGAAFFDWRITWSLIKRIDNVGALGTRRIRCARLEETNAIAEFQVSDGR